MEILLTWFGELILQLVIEVLAQVGLHAVAEPFRAKPDPWLAVVGYLVFGSVAGAISLWVFPSLMIASPFARLVNLGLTPVAAGGVAVALGAWRRARDQDVLRIDRFAYAYLFALTLALVRFCFGH